MTRPKPIILDISEHQLPSQMNYQQLAKEIELVIVRIQYGLSYEDGHFQTHLSQFKKYQVPVNVYAWLRGRNEDEMRAEAKAFYRRAAPLNPSFWWLDIEEKRMDNVVKGADAYRRQLKKLGAKKVGAYIANHRFHEFGFSLEHLKAYEGVWLPTYGQNDGYYRGIRPNATKLYDLHQYTSRGRLPGYQGNLDLSRLASDKPISFFSSGLKPSKSSYQVGDSVVISGIYASSDSMTKLKPLYSQGVITKILVGKPNPYLLNKGMGWVNQSVMEPSRTQSRYQVKSGETLSEVAQKLGLSWQYLAKINDLANPNLIYPGQWLNY